MITNDDSFDNEGVLRSSKSQKKRYVECLQRIGEKLILLKNLDLEKLNLPERLLIEIQIAKKITSNIALKRQKQFIGKIMRECDASAIIEALDRLDTYNVENVRSCRMVSGWVDKLLNNDNMAIDEIRKCISNANIQHIRNLQRNAIKELDQNVNVSKKILFCYLKDQLCIQNKDIDDAALN